MVEEEARRQGSHVGKGGQERGQQPTFFRARLICLHAHTRECVGLLLFIAAHADTASSYLNFSVLRLFLCVCVPTLTASEKKLRILLFLERKKKRKKNSIMVFFSVEPESEARMTRSNTDAKYEICPLQSNSSTRVIYLFF